jgi:hypothetical protein
MPVKHSIDKHHYFNSMGGKSVSVERDHAIGWTRTTIGVRNLKDGEVEVSIEEYTLKTLGKNARTTHMSFTLNQELCDYLKTVL